MKKYIFKVFVEFIFIIYAQTVHSQAALNFDNKFLDTELLQINEFIKNAFPKSHKYKEKERYFNKNSKIEKEIEMNYKSSLTDFKSCNISFSKTLKSSEKDYSEKVSFSLKDIYLIQTLVVSKKGQTSFSFYSNTNSIKSRRYSYDDNFTGGEKTYKERGGSANFYMITMQSDVSSVDIEDAIKRAITLCQAKK